MALSPDGQLLAVIGYDNSIWLGNTKDRQLGKLQAKEVDTMAFSPDSQHLLTGGKDGTIRLWDNKGKPLNKELPKHQGSFDSVQISPDNKLLAIIGNDYRVWLGKTTDKQLRKLKPKEVYTMAFSSDSQRLITGGRDGLIRLWSNQGRLMKDKLADHKSPVFSLALSRDDRRLVTAGIDGTTRLWDLKDRESQLFATLPEPQPYVWSVAISPDGKKLATNGYDRSVRLYQIPEELGKLVEMNCEWLRDYLKNPDAALSTDRPLCDGIRPPSSSPKK